MRIKKTKRSFKYLKFHLIAIIILVVFVCIISFYQIFTNDRYQPYFQRQDLLNKSGWYKLKSLFKQSRVSDPLDSEYLYIKNEYLYHKSGSKKNKLKNLHGLKLSQAEVSPNKDKAVIVFQDNKLNWFLEILSLNDIKNLYIQPFGRVDKLQIIQWGEDNNQIFLSVKTDSWRVDKYQIDNKKLTNIYKDLKYDKERLSYSISPLKNNIIVPQCDDICSLLTISIANGQNSLIKLEKDIQSSNIEMQFFEEELDRIGYIALDKKYYYIIDKNGYLWHKISLSDSERKMEFIGFQITHNKLNLIAHSKSRNEVYTYNLLFYGLNIINLDKDVMPIQQVNSFDNHLVVTDQQSNFYLLNLKNSRKEEIGNKLGFIKFF